MRHLIIILGVLFIVAGHAWAEGWKVGKDFTPWGIMKRPEVASAWKRAVASAKVPKSEEFWILEMPGPGEAASAPGPGGRSVVVGSTCRPHDCHDNNLAFVVDPTREQVFGLRQGRGDSPDTKQFIGAPDAAMQKLLQLTLTKAWQ